MSEAQAKNLDTPDETIRLPGVSEDLVELGDWTVGRTVQEPGWRWSTHTRPLVGGDMCEARHVGVVVSGRFGVVLRDGTTLEFGPNDVYHIPPGHDGYTIGDAPCVLIEWSGLRTFAGFRSGSRKHALATLLFTDIAEPTALGARGGDAAWRELRSAHYIAARSEIEACGGHEIKTTEDGLLATFAGPAQAIRCAASIRQKATHQGVRVRAGIHVGEVELVGSDFRGLTVRAAARILQAAGPDEILTSEITRTLAQPSGLSFEDRGVQEGLGLPGEWRLFAYTEAPER